jgi:hypothetical protein
MRTKEWFHAQIRWAVLVEGKRGLRNWEESAYIFLSEDHETAFRQALDVGHDQEKFYKEGRHLVAVKLAQIVTLDRLGANPTEFLVPGASEKATEYLPFDHAFDPDGNFPPPSF